MPHCGGCAGTLLDRNGRSIYELSLIHIYWDGREFDEYIITTEGVGAYGETPEEYLCHMDTLHELMAVLDTCTEAQRRRFLLYALEGLSLAEIGVLLSLIHI